MQLLVLAYEKFIPVLEVSRVRAKAGSLISHTK